MAHLKRESAEAHALAKARARTALPHTFTVRGLLFNEVRERSPRYFSRYAWLFMKESRAFVRERERIAKIIEESEARLRKASVAEILLQGEHLATLQDRHAHFGNGTFGKWVSSRFGFTRKTAENRANAYRVFKDEVRETVSQMDVSALYLLSRESTPKAALRQALERAAAGHRVTKKDALKLIRTHSPTVEKSESERQDALFKSLKNAWRQLDAHHRKAFLEMIQERTEAQPAAA